MASWPGFVVGIAVIFAYYIVFLLAESLTKGYYANPEAVKHGGRFMAAHLARWMPNIMLGLFGLAALIWRARYTEGGLSLRVPDGHPSPVRLVATEPPDGCPCRRLQESAPGPATALSSSSGFPTFACRRRA